jgi:hypothetical protein
MIEIVQLTGLTVNQLIVVKVRAHNSNGWGVFGEINIVGQVIQTIP